RNTCPPFDNEQQTVCQAVVVALGRRPLSASGGREPPVSYGAGGGFSLLPWSRRGTKGWSRARRTRPGAVRLGGLERQGERGEVNWPRPTWYVLFVVASLSTPRAPSSPPTWDGTPRTWMCEGF